MCNSIRWHRLIIAEQSPFGMSVFRKLQIPDGAPRSLRPQPRRPDFLKSQAHPHPPNPELLSTATQHEASCCDALPRVPQPHPPSPPILYHPSASRERQDDSFTFLPSTCSEESLLPPHRRPHAASRMAHTSDSLGLGTVHTEDEALLPHSQLQLPPSPGSRKTYAHMSPALLPPSVFEKPRATSATHPPAQDPHHPTTTTTIPGQPNSAALQPSQVTERTVRRSRSHGGSPSGSPLPPSSRGTVGATCGDQKAPRADLSDPGIRTEIVCLRDELKRFQELKSLQR